jgi:hypothetical protein
MGAGELLAPDPQTGTHAAGAARVKGMKSSSGVHGKIVIGGLLFRSAGARGVPGRPD